jgi:uncharacterized membrane protein
LKKKTEFLAQAGLIAAAYTVLTLLLQPLSFGAVQLRLSEILTILPVYTGAAVPGLTVGCFLSNLIGMASGANPAGAWDLLFGTAATGLAAVCSYLLRGVRFKGVPLLATVPPVVFNALIVGAELYLLYGGFPLWLHMVWVGLGQLGACTVGGTVLAVALTKTGLSHRLH